MPSPCHVLWEGTTASHQGQGGIFRITLARPTPEQSRGSVVIIILSLRRRNLETERSLQNEVIMPPRQEDGISHKIICLAHLARGRCLAHDNVVIPTDSFLHRELIQDILEYTQQDRFLPSALQGLVPAGPDCLVTGL